MAGVMEVLSQAGSLPIEELKLRAYASDDDVVTRVGELEKLGLVQLVEKPMVGVQGQAQNVQFVELTRKGFRSSLK